ncbi:MAG TPA: ABC transporter substrate-binding protein [Polyangiaceae bacterium]|nr:ABC transporter substrate-binding protein [Polyangiaceae bacterium]
MTRLATHREWGPPDGASDASRITRRSVLQGAVGAVLLHSSRARAEVQPAAVEPIVVGMSTALSGPARALGTAMMRGVQAYLDVANAQGGIAGRPLRLEALDDAYEPARCSENVRRLIDQSHVFAIVGNVGTPTAAVTVPIANEKKVPFFGPFTGAGLLRKTPPDRYVVNFRASYAQETAEMVRGLVSDLRVSPERIAFFTQDDAYGDSGYSGATQALRAVGFDRPERLPHGRYPRNTSDVEGGLARILDPRVSPAAVIMVGAYSPCAKFIKLARRYGLRAVFANVSFVGSEALAAELGPAGEGVVVTQVVPHYDSDLPVVREYRAALLAEDVGFVSLEGFIVARAFVQVMRRAGAKADRESFIDVLESGEGFDLGLDAPRALSRDVHQFSNRVWPTYIRGGRFVPMRSWGDLAGGK